MIDLYQKTRTASWPGENKRSQSFWVKTMITSWQPLQTYAKGTVVSIFLNHLINISLNIVWNKKRKIFVIRY